MEAKDLEIDEFYIYEDENSHIIVQYTGIEKMTNDTKLWYRFVVISHGNNYYHVAKDFSITNLKYITPIIPINKE